MIYTAAKIRKPKNMEWGDLCRCSIEVSSDPDGIIIRAFDYDDSPSIFVLEDIIKVRDWFNQYIAWIEQKKEKEMTKPNNKLPWEILSDYPGYRLVPESEAHRLAALDERVKLAEEAARIIGKLYESGLIETKSRSSTNISLESGIKLLREFMKGME